MPGDSTVAEIKEKLNIADVVSDYVQLKKVGANFRARCPFHQEKTPSFYVTPARQIWHCFGCGLGGDVFEFVKQAESVDFPEALKILAARAGVELPAYTPQDQVQRAADQQARDKLIEINDLAARYYHKILLESGVAAEAREYLARRKLTQATIEEWRIGYAPDAWEGAYVFLRKRGYADRDIVASGLAIKRDEGVSAGYGRGGGYFDRFRDRIMFPITDMSGRVIAFTGRLLHPNEQAGKYINSPESPVYRKGQVLFGLYQARTAIRQAESAIVVEGNMDAIKSFQSGIRNVVASSGTAFTESQLSKLSRLCSRLIFAFDADAAGLVAARRALEGAVAAGFEVRLAALPEGVKDPDELIDRDPESWRASVAGAQDHLTFYFERIFGILDTTDPHAKRRAVADFLGLLKSVSDPILLAHYVSRVARAVGVKEEVVAGLLRSSRSGHAVGKESRQAPQPRPQPPGYLQEQLFFGCLFRRPEQALSVVSQLDQAFFIADGFAELYRVIKEFIGKTGGLDTEIFRATYPDLAVMVDHAIVAADPGLRGAEDDPKELAGLARKIILTALQRQREELTREITAAETRRDAETRRALTLRFHELTQKIRSLEGGE